MPARRSLVAMAGIIALTSLALLEPQSSAGAAGSGGPEFSTTATVSRVHLTNGADEVVETRHVTVTVSQTTNLRDRQGLEVTWSGAHPTGGILPDPNSAIANQEEYPVVLVECRGVDSTSAPAAQQLDPTKCWTATPSERYFPTSGNVFPPWRLDRYASPPDRTANPGQPAPRPGSCGSVPDVERWVPFVSVTGHTYYGGPNGCAGLAPEGATADATLSFPSNTTYGVSDLAGNGNSIFDVRDSTDNASLGCSDTVPCALVVIPIMGIGCDIAAAGLPAADQPVPGPDADKSLSTCRGTGHFAPGQLVSIANGSEDVAVSGSMWWSASNWRNRVTVPLKFSPPSNVCDLAGGKPPVLVYGSELMTQATTAWAPAFCLNKSLTAFKHVQVGEPQARSLVSQRTIEAGLVSAPPPEGGYPHPTVHTPVAVTGFAITYIIDDGNRDRYTKLKLDARLLAKLMTESYQALNGLGDPDLAGNPVNITRDPEFVALNPDVGLSSQIPAATILSIASDSDVLSALTAYINADPDARAWIAGTPDPWGMVVNPNYKNIPLPTDSWPLLDTYEPMDYYNSGNNTCLQLSPVPYLPLVAAPMSRLAYISLAMQYSIANSQVNCVQPLQGSTDGQKLTNQGRQNGGFRFMLGLTSLADAERFGLDEAALQTQVAAGTPAKFTSGAGRSFVTPTTSSLRAASDLLVKDSTTKDWQVPYDTLRTDPRGAAAYPGTMVVYADVMTAGLPASDAAALGQFLRFAAGPGQTSGVGVGQLPAGYLPMTSANGLGALAAATVTAAGEVATQAGNPPPVATPTPVTEPATSTDTSTPSDTGSTPAAGSTAAPSAPAGAGATPSAAAGPKLAPVSLGRTGTGGSGLGSLALPAVMGLAMLAVVGAVLTYLLGRRKVAP